MSYDEYKALADALAEIVVGAAARRGKIAVAGQEAYRQARRREAADRWAESDDVQVAALDLSGEPSKDGPIPTAEGVEELASVVEAARAEARRTIGGPLSDAEKLAGAAPADLAAIVTSMQLRHRADHGELAALYTRCAAVSRPLALSVADAARANGLLIWDERGALDADAPLALAHAADKLLDQVAGRSTGRPTEPADELAGRGVTVAEGALLDALDGAAMPYGEVADELAGDGAVVAVYDALADREIPVRSTPGAPLDGKALRRVRELHETAEHGNQTDHDAINERIERAFRVR